MQGQLHLSDPQTNIRRGYLNNKPGKKRKKKKKRKEQRLEEDNDEKDNSPSDQQYKIYNLYLHGNKTQLQYKVFHALCTENER